MPSLHLLRSSYHGLVYDFPCDLGGIVGGYGLRFLCLYYFSVIVRFHVLGIVEGPKTKPYRGCTEPGGGGGGGTHCVGHTGVCRSNRSLF